MNDKATDSLESRPASFRARAYDLLGIERNVAAASSAFFLLGLGEELWRKFLPKYLESLGASTFTIGVFGTVRDFLDAIYQYPGGWFADRFGRRRAFQGFIMLASLGYLFYMLSPSWPFVFIGLVFSIAWVSMASPAIFAVIADALPRQRRARGFTLQSILKRLPMTVAPIIGGLLIAKLGVTGGVRAGLAATIALALISMLIIRRIDLPITTGERVNIAGVWRSFHTALRRLLISDIIIRACEGMAEILIIIYVTNIIGLGVSEYGLLVAIQMAVSILAYLPAARLSDRIGRKPFVVATFVCFALFPVAVVLSSGFWSLAGAFVIGGLREIGEPSRKAMIVDLAESHVRARTVGLYYLIRSLSITPASAVGGLIWTVSPKLPFLIAGAIGLVGVLVFALTVEERYAS